MIEVEKHELRERIGHWSGGVVSLCETDEGAYIVKTLYFHPVELFKARQELNRYKSYKGARRKFDSIVAMWGK